MSGVTGAGVCRGKSRDYACSIFTKLCVACFRISAALLVSTVVPHVSHCTVVGFGAAMGGREISCLIRQPPRVGNCSGDHPPKILQSEIRAD